MTPKVSKGMIESYKYREGMHEIIYPREDILFFHYSNPSDPYRGASPVQRKAYAYDTDKYNMIYQLNVFKNGAHLKGVLESDLTIKPDQANKILALFEETYGGAAKAHKTGVLTGGLKYKNIGISNKDMEFMLLAEWTMRQLASAYHTPPQKLSHPENTNLANMQALDTAWNRECILPRLIRISEIFNTFLIPLYKEDGLHCEFDNPIPEDEEFLLKKRESNLKNWVISPNEARVEDGMDEAEWGKVPLVPFNVMPLSGDKKPTVELSPEKMAEFTEDLREVHKKKITEEYKENYWKAFIRRVTPLENEFRRGITKLFQEQEIEALRALRKGKSIVEKDVDDVLRITHDEREIAKFIEFVLPRITETLRLNGTESFIELGVEGSFDVTNPKVVAWIKKRCGNSIKGIADTTKDLLRKTLIEGIESGESIPKLASRVKAVYEDAKGFRATRIARTEILSASNKGAIEAYRQSEVVKKKEWYCALDERTCEECSAMHKEIVGLDENFSSGVDAPPNHVQCRCVILPVLDK